jgi:glutathione synthase/RimK-type ligase-like ATP-grasp enzyme
MHKNIAIAFSKDYPQDSPFAAMGAKKPVYEELLSLCQKKGLTTYVVNINRYKGNGIFEIDNKDVKIDLVYDRSGSLKFPAKGDGLRVVDNYDFKKLAWNKWEAYKILSDYMPQTVLVDSIAKLSSEKIVVKPVNGLKGMDIFIGNKKDFKKSKLNKNKIYIAQEFIDTSYGIKDIVDGLHDLRVVIINKKIVWSHVRTPTAGSLKANVAGGRNLTEVAVSLLPKNIVQIAQKIADKFYKEYDNPLFSLDFGVDEKGRPYIFEINDQIGFPLPSHFAKDLFLKELVENFLSKV